MQEKDSLRIENDRLKDQIRELKEEGHLRFETL